MDLISPGPLPLSDSAPSPVLGGAVVRMGGVVGLTSHGPCLRSSSWVAQTFPTSHQLAWTAETPPDPVGVRQTSILWVEAGDVGGPTAHGTALMRVICSHDACAEL